jgi:BCD family chlorophyll transporter-like MFS transporter
MGAVGDPGARGERSFAAALHAVWSEPQARGFTLFVFVSMLAYSAQELLLEPFCGLVFGYSLGDSARLSGLWHGAAFMGMVCIGIACSAGQRPVSALRGWGSLCNWTIGGCCASALAIMSLACASLVGPGWPLRLSVAALGLSNGVFAVAAIGSMMELAHREGSNAGVRMGLWGAAQAVAFALGGVFGTAIVDAARWLLGSASAFATVFAVEAALFFIAARLAARVNSTGRSQSAPNVTAVLT